MWYPTTSTIFNPQTSLDLRPRSQWQFEVDILSSTRSDAALAVQSIPAYVEASEFWQEGLVTLVQEQKPWAKVHGIGYTASTCIYARRDDVK